MRPEDLDLLVTTIAHRVASSRCSSSERLALIDLQHRLALRSAATRAAAAAGATAPHLDYVPLSTLASAAAMVANCTAGVPRELLEALQDALVGLHVAVDTATCLDPITRLADAYGDDVDVVGNFTHHNGLDDGAGGGYWVDAWVWVASEDDEEASDAEGAADRDLDAEYRHALNAIQPMPCPAP